MSHYKGFIEVASCLASLRHQVGAMSDHLSALQEEFPALNSACGDFTKEAKQHLAKRAQNKQLQSECSAYTNRWMPVFSLQSRKTHNTHALYQSYRQENDLIDICRIGSIAYLMQASSRDSKNEFC